MNRELVGGIPIIDRTGRILASLSAADIRVRYPPDVNSFFLSLLLLH